MTPTARNAAIAAAVTLIPAIAAAAFYPERARALPGRVGDRVRDIFEDDDDVEATVRRLVARLDALTHRLDRHDSFMDRARDVSPGAAIAAGLAALVVIPTALTAIFAPHRLREARDAAMGYWSDHDDVGDELSGLSSRLDELTADIEKQRDSNFDAVTRAARDD